MSLAITSVRGRIIGLVRERLLGLPWCTIVRDAEYVDTAAGGAGDSAAAELAAGRSVIELIVSGDEVTRDNAAGPSDYRLYAGLIVLLPTSMPLRAGPGAGIDEGGPVLAAELAAERCADVAEAFTGPGVDRTLGGLATDIKSIPSGGVGLHPLTGEPATDLLLEIDYSVWPGQPRRARSEAP